MDSFRRNYLAIFVFVLPTIIILSGKAAVLVLAIFMVEPLHWFILKRKKRDFIIFNVKQNKFDRYLLNTTFVILFISLLVFFNIDNLVLFSRFLILGLMCLFSVKYYKNKKIHDFDLLYNNYALGLILSLFIAMIEFKWNAPIAELFYSIVSPEKIFSWQKQLNMMNRGMCFLSMTLWPLAYGLRKRSLKNLLTFVLIFIGVIFVVFMSHSETAKMTIVVSMICTTFIILIKENVRFLFSAGILICLFGFLVSLFFVNPQNLSEKRVLQNSALVRVCIWKYTMLESLREPFGHGLNSSRQDIFRQESSKGLCVEGDNENGLGLRNYFYGIQHHPHNFFLQIFFEFGAFGLILYLLIHIRIIHYLWNMKLGLFEKSLLFNVFLAYFLVGLTGYGIWQNWIIAILSVNLILLYIFIPYDRKVEELRENDPHKRPQPEIV